MAEAIGEKLYAIARQVIVILRVPIQKQHVGLFQMGEIAFRIRRGGPMFQAQKVHRPKLFQLQGCHLRQRTFPFERFSCTFPVECKADYRPVVESRYGAGIRFDFAFNSIQEPNKFFAFWQPPASLVFHIVNFLLNFQRNSHVAEFISDNFGK
ncbi:MAG: hypothetical protein ABJE99_07480 [Roseobacter sp.]